MIILSVISGINLFAISFQMILTFNGIKILHTMCLIINCIIFVSLYGSAVEFLTTDEKEINFLNTESERITNEDN